MQIKGPFSYSGNKYRIYSKFLKHTIEKYEKIYEPFCGSAVCLYNSVNGGIGIDIDNNVICLHNSLFDKNLIEKIQIEYDKYFPNGRTAEGYYLLRKKFNESWSSQGTNSDNVHLLHLLIQLSFNSLMRFGKFGYNTPYGKKNLNLDKIKIHQNIILEKEIEFLLGDYKTLNLSKVIKNKDLIYFDPPYLASKFQYNGWNKDNEIELLSYLDDLNKAGYKFLLSNTFLHRGVKNDDLINWSKDYNVETIKMSYNAWSSAVYHVKKESDTVEVIIKNIN